MFKKRKINKNSISSASNKESSTKPASTTVTNRRRRLSDVSDDINASTPEDTTVVAKKSVFDSPGDINTVTSQSNKKNSASKDTEITELVSKSETTAEDESIDKEKQDGKHEDNAEVSSNIKTFSGNIQVAKFLNIPKERQEFNANKRKQMGIVSSGSSYGPSSASSTIKSTTMTDYAPDICKDYKQNGFCGFGDTCKFLHIREDYAAGWKLDKRWEERQKKKQSGVEDNEEDEDDLLRDSKSVLELKNGWKPKRKYGAIESSNTTNKLESKANNEADDGKCGICHQDYKFPVVTPECNHVFCESCFLKEFNKSKDCKKCGTKLMGVVNPYKKPKDNSSRKLISS